MGMGQPFREIDIESFSSTNIRVESPDGRMFVTIMEAHDGRPFRVLINIGKSGSSLAAWANCVAEFVSMNLQNNGLDQTIQKLMGITSDRVAFARSPVGGNQRVSIRSGPEALAHALVLYRTDKYHQHLKGLGLKDEDIDDDEDFDRPADAAL